MELIIGILYDFEALKLCHSKTASFLFLKLAPLDLKYYLRQKKRNALEESWFIVAKSVQIHSLDVPDVPST